MTKHEILNSIVYPYFDISVFMLTAIDCSFCKIKDNNFDLKIYLDNVRMNSIGTPDSQSQAGHDLGLARTATWSSYASHQTL